MIKSKKSKQAEKERLRKKRRQEIIFVALLLLVVILGLLNLAKVKGWLIPRQPELVVTDGVVDLDTMSLEQKIAQMLVVQGNVENMLAWKNMQVGGVHLFGRRSESVFRNTILDYQYELPIPLFITVDLEGCINPFGYFRNFTPASEIDSVGEAFEKGFEEGRFLSQLGITLNFAPVVDLEDEIWRCRSFPGNDSFVSELAQSYVLGLQTQGVIATAKHYPGRTLSLQDPHKFIVTAEITPRDLYPYRYLLDRGNVGAVMVSHLITSGALNSGGVPAVVSPKVISGLQQQFGGLIITDEIHMLGLKNFYNSLDEMYLAVFQAGNDVVLNFQNNPHEIYRMIQVVAQAVREDKIPEEQIDKSVAKILMAKGLRVK